MIRMAFVVVLLGLSSVVGADSLWSGTWILREPPQGGHLTMTVQEVGTGWKLTYKIVDANAPGDHLYDHPDAARRQGRPFNGRRQANGPNDGDSKDR